MCALITHSLSAQRRQRGESGPPPPPLLLQRLLAWTNVNGRRALALAVGEQRDPVAVLMLLHARRAAIELSRQQAQQQQQQQQQQQEEEEEEQEQLLRKDVHAALRWAALEQPPGWREILTAGVRRRRQPKTSRAVPMSSSVDRNCPCASVCAGSEGQGYRHDEYREQGSGYGEEVEAEACFGATEAGHALIHIVAAKGSPATLEHLLNLCSGMPLAVSPAVSPAVTPWDAAVVGTKAVIAAMVERLQRFLLKAAVVGGGSGGGGYDNCKVAAEARDRCVSQ
eukprot:COSAG06_NODE_1492_length_9279_cov_835.540632_10_plen_282_part_00